jgi:hypothetical protein
MLSLYASARRRHADIRSDVYSFVQEDFIREGGFAADLRITDIDRAALEAWHATWIGKAHPLRGGWNWPELLEWMPHRAAVLPAALWYGEDLCGLILGRVSRHRRSGVRHTVTLTHVERRPEPPPVVLRGRVVLLAIAIAEGYGAALGGTRLRLGFPDPRLVRWYQELGFDVARVGGRAVYCEREILR